MTHLVYETRFCGSAQAVVSSANLLSIVILHLIAQTLKRLASDGQMGFDFLHGRKFCCWPSLPNRLWDPSSLQFNGYKELFPPGIRRRERVADTQLHIRIRLRTRGALPVLPHEPE